MSKDKKKLDGYSSTKIVLEYSAFRGVLEYSLPSLLKTITNYFISSKNNELKLFILK